MKPAPQATVRCASCAMPGALGGRDKGALRRRRLLLVCVALLAFAPAAVSAQTNIYQIRGNATAGSNNLWSVNPATGAETLVYSNYPGGNAATLAQRPSDGMIFYAINSAGGSNGAVYRFNPATPNVAPVLLGNLGGGVSSGFRMAFLGATLYYMSGGGGADNDRLYTVNQTTGAATAGPNITGTGNGGDMAFLGATLYIVNQSRQLYTATTAGGAATLVGALTFPGGITPNTLGAAFDSSGRLLVQTINPSNLYRFTLPSLSGTLVGALGGGTTATGDLASASVPAPDLSITKTDGVTNTFLGETLTYTIVVTNNGTYSVTGAITDNVPAALTGVTWTCAASAGSSCAAASGSGNTINTSATLAAGGTATYTVNGVVAVASGTISNTATVAVPAWLADATPANNSATDTDNVAAAANVSIVKTAATTFAVGSNASYTLAVSNAGPQSAAGPINVSDTLPAGLAFVSATGTGWTCANGAAVTCAHAGPIASGASLPNITLTVAVAAAAAPNVSNTATVSSATFDPVSADNSSAVTTPVLYLQLVKSQAVSSATPTPGATITYTVTFNNLGGAAVQNLAIVDMVPLNTDFRVGSAAYTYGSAPTIEYSNAARVSATPPPTPSPFTLYTPIGAAGSYDPQVNWVRWTFPGSIPAGATGSVSFVVRIR